MPADLVLLDTSVVLHLLRGNEIGRRIDEALELRTRAERPLICVVSVGEALAFARRRNWGPVKTTRLEQLLRELVVMDINNSAVLTTYAEIHAFLVDHGRVLSDNDVWIAAAAAAASALLVTTDGDFAPLDPGYLRIRHFPSTR